MKSKRGQFYLIATIVIIGLIIGVFVLANYSKGKSQSRVYELGSELKRESGKMLDYGATTGNYPWASFTGNFSGYAGKDINIIFLTGTLSSYEVYQYNNTIKQSFPYTNISNLVTISVDGTNYNFKMRKGQNFYFVMYQYIEGERYVSTN
jgi:hypothetical protein